MPKASRESFGEALLELAGANPRLVVLDADLSKSTMTQDFAKKFPDRHFDFGIAEHNMIGAAAGLALCGKIPFAASFACFLIGRLETIRIAVAYNQTNVKLVGTHAGLGIGDDGASQMGLEDIAAMRALPNMTVIQPADALETKQAVAWALSHDGPVYLRLTRQKLDDVHNAEYQFAFGKPDIVWEPSSKPRHYQASIFASGGTVGPAIVAAKDLFARGFNVRVVNVATLAPFEGDMIESLALDSSRFVTVEDHNIVGGLGSAVSEAVAHLGAAVPLVRLGARSFGESGTAEELYHKHGLSAPHIVEACLKNLA
jgi:transketolase